MAEICGSGNLGLFMGEGEESRDTDTEIILFLFYISVGVSQSTFAVLRHTADRSKMNSKQGMSDMHHSNLMQSTE